MEQNSNKQRGRPPKQQNKEEAQETLPAQEEDQTPSEESPTPDSQSQSEKESTETVKPPSLNAQGEPAIGNDSIILKAVIDDFIVSLLPELKNNKDLEIGKAALLTLPLNRAVIFLLRRIERLERVVELLYHVKSFQITTPESLDLKGELDRMIKHKTQ